jgi:hypothetical protein
MPRLFGRSWTAAELRARTGGLCQLAGVRLLERNDGSARGMRVAEVWTGSGLRFEVLIDRALDIGAAKHAGRPLAFVHPALGPPARHEPGGEGWLRTFGGGLVTTCGLVHFGAPEPGHGLHGRISHVPGEKVSVREEWEADDYVLEVRGEARETSALGENLLLARRIRTRLGASSLVIEDEVRNDGARPTPHMLLYHCNVGFPALGSSSELLLSPGTVRPRDDVAAAGLVGHRRFGPPEAEAKGQVFFHDLRPGPDGRARAAIVDRGLGFGVFLRYRAAELPCFAQWKMMAAGGYVCGLEPGTNWEAPRQKLEAEGRLRLLAPGEEVRYELELGALACPEEVSAFEAETRTP